MALTKITSTNIGANAVTSALIANVSSATITSGLGYTPANKAGDTLTGSLIVRGDPVSLVANGVNCDITARAPTSGYASMSIDGYSTSYMFLKQAGTDVARITANTTNLALATGSSNLDRLVIDASGRITTPYQPAFRATPSSGTYTTTTDSGQLMSDRFTSLGNGGYNIGGHYNTSTGIFTAPVAGYYLAFAGVRWETNAFTQNSYIRIFISLNNGDYNSAGCMAINGNNEAWANYMNMNISGVVYMNANDNIRLKGGMDGGTTTSFHSESYFGAYLLG